MFPGGQMEELWLIYWILHCIWKYLYIIYLHSIFCLDLCHESEMTRAFSLAFSRWVIKCCCFTLSSGVKSDCFKCPGMWCWINQLIRKKIIGQNLIHAGSLPIHKGKRIWNAWKTGFHHIESLLDQKKSVHIQGICQH